MHGGKRRYDIIIRSAISIAERRVAELEMHMLSHAVDQELQVGGETTEVCKPTRQNELG